ncbi:hypothetical protein GOP47_0003825 [Adiantum capillus-veneris]|uniref:Mitofilin n=1 Tax=Adiantum capillus-veneris TaxID=13818 RepID=A0A9D4V701_ADICA|nr:hypothetical protein GOP47_0003825 [Adiantum capillus-veneris]
MAHRQLNSLVRRIRRPLPFSAPVHHRTCQHSLDVQQQQRITDFCFNKVGNRFFSKALPPRKATGKGTSVHEKVVSSRGQNSESHTPLHREEVHQDQPKSSDSSEQSSSNKILILGAGFAIVVGLLAFFPWDSLKSYYTGKRKDTDVLLKNLKETIGKDVVIPPKGKQETEEKKQVLKDSKHSTPMQNQKPENVTFEPGKQETEEKKQVLKESKHSTPMQNQEPENVTFEPGTETHKGEVGHTQDAELLKKTSDGSAYPDATESMSVQNVFPSDDVREKISAVMTEEDKTSEAELKDEVSPVIGHVKDHLPTLSDDFKGNRSLGTSKRRDELSSGAKRPSLLEAYYLGEIHRTSIEDDKQLIENKDDLNSHRHGGSNKFEDAKGEDFGNKLHIEGVQNVLDLLEVVHAAERRQAELDAQLYTEAQKRLKQAFQRELKDAQAKEVMYAEEASRLAKEIELEKENAAAALELEQKMARERLSEELKHKEEEANLKLKKAELLSKTEIAAAVAEEKLSYIKDVRNVKQELEALYMVLNTQSNEFRQSHTIHKLAVGTFALEDAMKRGAPIEKEVNLIYSSYKNAGSDPLVDAIISSLPEHAIKEGTLTPSQLQQKFESLKNGVLELSLIPSTGGGLISHAAAKVVSALKVKESGQFSDGVAAVISQVQRRLADGKLADAAELLEKGVQGTKAEGLVADWIQSARERAIMEQMLLLLHAHTTASASSLA